MKISEAAKLTGMNVSSIRFYERKGLRKRKIIRRIVLP